MQSYWRSRKRRELSIWLLVFAVLIGVANAFLSRVGWDPWILGTLAIACVALAAVLAFVKEKGKVADAKVALHQQNMRTRGPESMLGLAAKDIPLSTWGVHSALAQIPYLRRDAEEEVRAAIAQLRPVLILGSSMAGKTRLAAEIVQELFPDMHVFMPDPPDGVANIMNAGEMPKRHVVWLDDLERYLQDSKTLKTRWIEDLQKNENVLVATMRGTAYETFMPSNDQPRTQWDTLQCFTKVYLSDRTAERQRLAALSGSSEVSKGVLDYGLGTYLGGGFLAVEMLDAGRVTNPVGRAFVLAAIDWQRTGVGEFIPEVAARRLVSIYVDGSKHQPSEEDLAAGLEWATAKTVGGSLFGLLAKTGEGALRPFDYLVDHIAASGEAIPLPVWRTAAESEVPTELLNNAGITAQFVGQEDIAALFFERAAHMGDSDAMVNYAISLDRQDRISEAMAWDKRAAEAGNPRGLTGLAVMLLREGKTQHAERLFRRAAALGNGSAMTNLGYILIGRGETAEGIDWHKRAAEAGSALGMTNYGLQLELQGDLVAAESWYRKAESKGDGAALFQLAMLANKQGAADEVEPLLREAVRRGNPAAMGWLGSILAAKGSHDEADDLYKRAADRGGAVGLAMVGKKLADQGEYDEAEKLLKRAAEQKLPLAITGLGVLYARTGRVEAAKAQYSLGISAGDDQARLNLGLLLIDSGETGKGKALLRDAANLGSSDGMYLLSQALLSGGKTVDAAEAEILLEKAAVLGNLDALCESGKRAADQGDLNKAFQRLQQAADEGHVHAAECLDSLKAQTGGK